MGTNVGLTYVKDFTFPAEQGFTGSASSGVHQVKGYQRGGHVKKMGEGGKFGKPGDKYPNKGARQTMPKNVKKRGGPVKKQMGGYMGGMGQEREISVDDVRISVPKKQGGYMKGGASMHDKLKSEGAKMGYAYGGRVKESNTSGEFKQTRGKMPQMDTGNQPARRGRNQAEIEAGGTKRLKPGLNKGGRIKGVADSGGGALADAALVRVRQVLKPSKKKMKSPDKARGRGMSKKGMPANVKAKGGHVYATGGVVKKAGAAL